MTVSLVVKSEHVLMFARLKSERNRLIGPIVGRFNRKDSKEVLTQRLEQRKHESAVKLQAHARGKAARKEAAARRETRNAVLFAFSAFENCGEKAYHFGRSKRIF